MTTFTDKEMIKEIKERIGSLDVRDNIERRAYEIALASLEAEPVAWLHSDNGLGIPAITRSKNVADSWLSKGWYVQPLYIAKPVPVVPDARPSLKAEQELIVTINKYASQLAAEPIAPNDVREQTAIPQVTVTPDGWISCSERMPAQDDWILIYSKHGEYMAGQVQGEYVELSDGTLSWLGNALFWMPLPEPPQEVK